MKKILLFLTALTTYFTGTAQLHRGRVLLGGGFSAQTTTRNSPGSITYVEDRSLTVYPGVAYFYKENRSVGTGITYSHSDNLYGESEHWGVSLSLNRYFPVGKNFFVAAHGVAAYSTGEARSKTTDYRRRERNAAVDLSAAVAYVAGNRFLFEAGLRSLVSLYYNHARATGSANENERTNTYGLSTSVGNSNPLFISFNILLGK